MKVPLRLHNTFTKTLNAVDLRGTHLRPGGEKPTYGSLYICGPTVYSESHVGHALTYIRADLFRRFMKSIFNVKLITVMNITDIDDKILNRTKEELKGKENWTSDPETHPFNEISERYYKSFLSDIKSLRVLPADMYIRVSKSIHLITRFIRCLEESGYAYRASTGDIHFKVTSLENYKGRLDLRKENSQDPSKLDPRDFVLWKACKAGEPSWSYKGTCDNDIIWGRPGWHVQCSAIASALFGNQLDFHFGGKDLIFPHHYNEEACCCAFHQLDTSKSMHVWSKNWMHSGHLVWRQNKMSKSLGNVIAIKDFIKDNSVDVLRLLCILTHYRSDIEMNDELLSKVKTLDHKLKAFASFLVECLKISTRELPERKVNDSMLSTDIDEAITRTNQLIIEGICEDFELSRGLEAILDLARFAYSKGTNNISATEVVACMSLLKEWCDTCGLEYTQATRFENSQSVLLETLVDFRQKVRQLTIEELSARAELKTSKDSPLHQLLGECDKLRTDINKLGFVPRDPKSRKI